MALVFGDRVKETTSTTGLVAYVLTGAAVSYQSFADSPIGDGDQCAYSVTDGNDWEAGIGTYSSGTNSISRDTIVDSSNGGGPVNWGAGLKFISNTPISSYAKQQHDQSYAGINSQTGTTYLLVDEDAGKIVECSNVNPVTVTIPLDAASNFLVNSRIDIIQTNLGQVTVSFAGTLWGFPACAGQWYALSLYKRAADHWVVIGGIP